VHLGIYESRQGRKLPISLSAVEGGLLYGGGTKQLWRTNPTARLCPRAARESCRPVKDKRRKYPLSH